MEAAVKVPLVRREFCRAYGTGIFEDWRGWPSFKVRFETAFWLGPVATAAGIIAGAQRQAKIRPKEKADRSRLFRIKNLII
ncbi:hypothetical protein [Lactiplantibacillus fabifermentans]|uniref:Uncharacterized protein n=2 Tax=Lactiplantibacillus fabifermentans TaxID=483011 RepID=A0A0R2NFT7_9LACO|nr:hypothetical protein [Lactiplantibacillus fabifermentans]ETY75452.1 hypothetical protein LFAB_01780 [Lactiplantibacillus fabifermentans T30PCM01]KRO24676.1 hypothetical protein DY78_GL001601 [Lactiplantibacillus fabifermentans DSM 21115]